MSLKSLALIPVLLAGVLLTAGQAAPVPKPKPSKLAILYAPDCNLADWLLIDADGTNPRRFVRPDGKREPIALLPGQEPVEIEKVPGESLVLLHPNGGDIRVSLKDGPILDMWRAWRWEVALDNFKMVFDPKCDFTYWDRVAAVVQVVRALGTLTAAEIESFSLNSSLISVSPDGSRVAFCRGFGQSACLLDLSERKALFLNGIVRNPKGSSTFAYRFSPDWNWIRYSTDPDPTVVSGSGVYLARIDGTCQTRVGDDAFAKSKRMCNFQQVGRLEESLPTLPGDDRRHRLAKALRVMDAAVNPDFTLAVLERDQTEDEASRFSICDLRTKREVPLPVGFGEYGCCCHIRWVRVPADRD